jgi:hypothetical protein
MDQKLFSANDDKDIPPDSSRVIHGSDACIAPPFRKEDFANRPNIFGAFCHGISFV